jgi:hypothetical protein
MPQLRAYPRLLPLALLFLSLLPLAPAAEVQHHGVVFENWIRNTFFDGYTPASYTQKWDIPAEANHRHGHIPANPKAAKYGSPVDLGDALRQFDIDEPFLLIIGYWQQHGSEKRFVNLVPARIEPAQWRALWHPITRADLERLDAVIKDRSLTPVQARAAARKIKNAPPFTLSRIVVNPKIDSKSQRRLQCSLRFADVFTHVAPAADPAPNPRPSLWNSEFPNPIPSPPRSFSSR